MSSLENVHGHDVSSRYLFSFCMNSTSAHSFHSVLAKQNQGKMVFKNQDAWRNHKLFQGLWKDPFPGLRTAAIIYGVYLGFEFGYKAVMGPSKPNESHH